MTQFHKDFNNWLDYLYLTFDDLHEKERVELIFDFLKSCEFNIEFINYESNYSITTVIKSNGRELPFNPCKIWIDKRKENGSHLPLLKHSRGIIIYNKLYELKLIKNHLMDVEI